MTRGLYTLVGMHQNDLSKLLASMDQTVANRKPTLSGRAPLSYCLVHRGKELQKVIPAHANQSIEPTRLESFGATMALLFSLHKLSL